MERVSTWNNIGKNVEECRSMEAVLSASGLDYTVIKKPVFVPEGNGIVTIPNRFATVREEDGHIYDVVSNRYEIIQNREAFDFVNYMTDEITFEKAGETESGIVYIIAKMEEVNILGDAFTPHVIFRNGFAGTVRINAAICPLRIVCQNQFNFSFKNTENTVAIRHMSNARERLEEAKTSLKMCADYMIRLNAEAEKYAGIKLDRFKLNAVLNELFPVTDTNISEHKRTLLKEQKMRFLKAYDADDNSNFKGTGWGLVNAYTDFVTHTEPRSKKPTRYENQFIRSINTNMNQILKVVDSVAV